MARDGSGTYALPATMAVSGAVASSVTVNSIMNDIAQALTDSINKDGTKAFGAAQSMGGNRLTSLGAATALTDAAQYSQLQKGNVSRAITVAGTVDAITLAFNPTITSLTTGQVIRWRSGGANTIAGATINVDSIGAVTVKKNPGAVDLAIGDLGVAGTENEATYNGTNWVLTTPTVGSGSNTFNENQVISVAGAGATMIVRGEGTTLSVVHRNTADATGPALLLKKGRGTIAAEAAVASSDILGEVRFQAFGGTNNRVIASIIGAVGTYVSDTDISSYLTFNTAAPGGVATTERLRITHNGGFAFGGAANYGTSGQFLKSNGDAAPTWAVAGPQLLGTITTTSGTSQSLTSLVLTGYKFLRLVFNGVSAGASGNLSIGSYAIGAWINTANVCTGIVDVDLGTGIAQSPGGSGGGPMNNPNTGNTGYSTATTTVTVTSGTTFDAGSILVYGW